MKTTIADSAGKIVRNIECPKNMVSIQAMPGEIAIDGNFDGETHFIDTALMVAVAKPARPTGDVDFDISTRSWVPIKRTAAELTASALSKRATLLAQCDWTQLPDVPLSTKSAWASYRQELRDITAQPGYPRKIIWPNPPT